MDDRAESQNSGATPKFSTLDWPGMVQAAKRARGIALRDMIFALGKWAKASNTDPLRVAPKR